MELAPCLWCNPLAPSICPHFAHKHKIHLAYDSFWRQTCSSSMGMTNCSQTSCQAVPPGGTASGTPLLPQSPYPASFSSVVVYLRTMACSHALCQLPRNLGALGKNVLLLCSWTSQMSFSLISRSVGTSNISSLPQMTRKITITIQAVDCVYELNAILQNYNWAFCQQLQ